MQIIDDSTAGGRIGSALGSALNQFAQQKLSSLQKSHQRNEFSQVLRAGGYSPSTANILAHLAEIDPKGLQSYMAALGSQGQQEQYPTQQIGGMQQIAQQQPQQMQQMDTTPLRQLMQNNPQAEQILQQLGQVIGQNPAQALQSMQSNPLLAGIGKQGLQAPGQRLTPQQPSAQPQQPQMPQQEQPAQPQRPNFAQSIANPASNKPITPAQQKQNDAVRKQIKLNKDLQSTAQRMLDTLETGKVDLGIWSHLTGKFDASRLNKETNQFYKDANKLVDLDSEGAKGTASKYRVQLKEAGKAGLLNGKEVNEQILRDYIQNADDSLTTIELDYPNLLKEPERQGPSLYGKVLSDVTIPGSSDGDIAKDSSGKKAIKKDGKWYEYKGH